MTYKLEDAILKQRLNLVIKGLIVTRNLPVNLHDYRLSLEKIIFAKETRRWLFWKKTEKFEVIIYHLSWLGQPVASLSTHYFEIYAKERLENFLRLYNS